MKKNALNRRQRMTERHQFVRLFDHPKVHKSKHFEAFYKENDEKHSRIGITIKGRLTSLWRTRIKRVVREWFRLNKEMFENIDVNIVLKMPKQVDWEYFDSLKKDLSGWKKLK